MPNRLKCQKVHPRLPGVRGSGVPSFRVCTEHRHNRRLLLGCGVLSLHSSVHIFPVPLIT